MKIPQVVVQIHPPKEETGYPGQIEEAHYTFENGTVTLVNHEGVPINVRGKAYEKKLGPGEDPHVIAGRLTKEAWQARGGGKRKFSAPIHYPKLGIV
jgi:hypothetical protein